MNSQCMNTCSFFCCSAGLGPMMTVLLRGSQFLAENLLWLTLQIPEVSWREKAGFSMTRKVSPNFALYDVLWKQTLWNFIGIWYTVMHNEGGSDLLHCERVPCQPFQDLSACVWRTSEIPATNIRPLGTAVCEILNNFILV